MVLDKTWRNHKSHLVSSCGDHEWLYQISIHLTNTYVIYDMIFQDLYCHPYSHDTSMKKKLLIEKADVTQHQSGRTLNLLYNPAKCLLTINSILLAALNQHVVNNFWRHWRKWCCLVKKQFYKVSAYPPVERPPALDIAGLKANRLINHLIWESRPQVTDNYFHLPCLYAAWMRAGQQWNSMCNVPGRHPAECNADYKQQYFSLMMSPVCLSILYSMFRAAGWRMYIIVFYMSSALHSAHGLLALVFTSPISLFYPAHIFHLNEHYSAFGWNGEHNQWFFQLAMTHFQTTNQSQPTVCETVS